MLDPREAIDRLTAAYRGPHPGHRTLHARGTFYEGTFTASPLAGELCRATLGNTHATAHMVPSRADLHVFR